MTFEILERVVGASDEIGVSDLAAQLNTTKATVFRHLKTLMELGYLSQNPATSRYRPGVKAFLLGQSAASRIDLLGASEAAMRDLREEVGLSVVLSSVGPRGLTVLATVVGKAALEIGVRPGTNLALHANAQGHVALAFGDPALRAGWKRQELTRFTPHTVTDPVELDAIVRRTRETGHAVAFEVETLGISAVAAPILDSAGHAAGTLALVGSVQYIPREPDAAIIDPLKRTALRISWNLGYKGADLLAGGHAAAA
ncbi:MULTISPECIES: IclR family transcriptional regulator [unclassified Burkholderia]|uniref:IclR family transcriptional regulator n=1 Tax=unclassified Burkholderia TaxID=2613784 RepID=UPI001C8A7381|nr:MULTISPECIES: IclR family transcriptional regulator [unclassified Burkholderia]